MGQHRISSRNSCETRNAVKSSVYAVSVDRRIFTLHPEKGCGPRSSENQRDLEEIKHCVPKGRNTILRQKRDGTQSQRYAERSSTEL